MGLPNKLYFLLTVAWWILLMGFGSCTSGLSISLFHFSALLIFQLGSCPQPRILSQPWSPWWALPTSTGLSVTSWGDPAWVGSWHTPRDRFMLSRVCLTEMSELMLFCWGICHGDPRWLTGREQVTATPRDSSAHPALTRVCWGVDTACPAQWPSLGMLRRGKNKILSSTEGTWHQMSWILLEKVTSNEFLHLLQQITHTYSSQPGFTCLARAPWLVAVRIVGWGSCWGHQAPCPSTCALPKPGVALGHCTWAWWQWDPSALL